LAAARICRFARVGLQIGDSAMVGVMLVVMPRRR
jgi:hypothetical protein